MYNKNRNNLKEIAPKSKLIKLINNIYNISDTHEAQKYQGIIDRLNLRYSVLCMEGRLELINELLRESQRNLNYSEKKALKFLLKDLGKKKDGPLTFFGFYVDCLSLTITEYAREPFHTTGQNFPYLHNIADNISPAGRLFVALSLTGLMATACTQKDDLVQAISLNKQETPIMTVQNPADNSRGNRASLGITDRMPETIDGLNSKNINEENRFANETEKKFSEQLKPYIVKKGDSIRNVSDKLGIDYRKVVSKNSIKYDKKRDWFMLYPGQILMLPCRVNPENEPDRIVQSDKKEPTKTRDPLFLTRNKPEDGFVYHFTDRGDSLWKISKKHHVSIKQIVEANGIKNPDMVKYGEILKIPARNQTIEQKIKPFGLLSHNQKVNFLKERTIREGHPYLDAIVEISEEYNIDSRLYAALIWEESWFDKYAKSIDNCRKLAQLDPRFHTISEDVKENFRKSLGYLRYEFVYYRKKGFGMKSAVICALAAYNGGNTRVRNYIKGGKWDGKNIETIPLKETRDHIKKILLRCKTNYHAIL